MRKAPSARWVEDLEEQETEEGSGESLGLITPRLERYLRAEQSLEAEVPHCGRASREVRAEQCCSNGKGANGGEEPLRCAEGETPGREVSCTRLGDEIRSEAGTRRKPSGGCERLRTERSEGWRPRGCEWTRTGDVAKRTETQAVGLNRKGTAESEAKELWRGDATEEC